jgi:hypothetical protein
MMVMEERKNIKKQINQIRTRCKMIINAYRQSTHCYFQPPTKRELGVQPQVLPTKRELGVQPQVLFGVGAIIERTLLGGIGKCRTRKMKKGTSTWGVYSHWCGGKDKITPSFQIEIFLVFFLTDAKFHDSLETLRKGLLVGSPPCLRTTGLSLAGAKLAKKARFQWVPLRAGPVGLSKHAKKF